MLGFTIQVELQKGWDLSFLLELQLRRDNRNLELEALGNVAGN